MGNITFKAYRQYPTLSKAQVKVEAGKLRLRLAAALFDEPDADEVWLAARDAWRLLHYVALTQPESEKRRRGAGGHLLTFTDAEIVKAARAGAKEAVSIPNAVRRTSEILNALPHPTKRTLRRNIIPLGVENRLPRLGCFIDSDIA